MEVKLPKNYTYLSVPTLVEDNDVVCHDKVFRVKEIKDAITAEKWIKEFSLETKTTWRKAATYPNAGRINIFRVDLRCVHLTDSRAQGLRPSKNTNCPAKLNIIVKRLNDKSRAKNKDDLLPDWPCIINFKAVHNHPLSDNSYKKFRVLFWQGHNASTTEQSRAESTQAATHNIIEDVCTQEIPTLSIEAQDTLKNFISRIKTGLCDQPALYVPAVEKMARNIKSYTVTETGLISALYTFAAFRVVATNKVRKSNRRSHTSTIGV